MEAEISAVRRFIQRVTVATFVDLLSEPERNELYNALKARLPAKEIALNPKTAQATLHPCRNEWCNNKIPDADHFGRLDMCRPCWSDYLKSVPG